MATLRRRAEAWLYRIAVFAGLPVLGAGVAAFFDWLLRRGAGPP